MAQNDSNSTLGAGTDSISVTGTSSAQSSTSGGYTPAPAQGGSQGGQGIAQQAQQAAQQLGDRASTAFNDVKGQATDRLGQVRDQAGQLKNTVADKLQQGAQALRQPAGGQQLAGAGGATAAGDDQIQRLAIPAANAMEKTADFLRNGTDLRGTIEEQVRTNPGRTLLIALGLGYVLGKAIRR